MKKLLTFLLSTILIVTLVACSGIASASSTSQTTTTASDSAGAAQQTSGSTSASIVVEYDPEDLEASLSSAGSTIRLEGDAIAFEGSGVAVTGTVVTVTSAGTYNINGTLNDGQIIVDIMDAETVVLVLNGANITSSTSAPIYVANAEKAVITLAEGTDNYVTDGSAYVFESVETDEPNAAIFSHDDLTINGSGSLTVNANYNNGIASKDDLKITGGKITVNAVNDGIKGRDSLAIKDGVIIVNAGADGLQANNDEEAEKGYIVIEGGTLNITSGLDGIQAETSLFVSGGDITITSGGGSVNNSTSGGGMWSGPGMQGNPNKPAESAKGLKAGVDITITAGTININSADDSIHANNSITIDGGTILLASGDDGIHADSTLDINGGELNLTQSYEGLESAVITINDGNIHLVASDDGINVAGGNDSSSINGRAGQNEFTVSGDTYLYINGGYTFIDAAGDGLDSNGPIDMTGGVVLVNGPTNNGNGPLDYTGSFNITGGFLVAVGSSGMAQAPSTTSTQYSAMYNFSSMQAAGTLVHIKSLDGEEILTFIPTKEYQSVLLSSSRLQNNETYVVYIGGSSTGALTDGLYSDGIYTPGTQVTSFTISSMVTGTGATGGGFPGGVPPTRP